MEDIVISTRIELLEITISQYAMEIKYNLYNNSGPDGQTKYNKEPLVMLLAKDAFKKAIDADKSSIGAKINLAGLLTYYGHKASAERLYQGLPDPSTAGEAGELMHPRAREYHYAQRQNKEKST